MYGNYYDYGDPDLSGLSTRTDQILADVRGQVKKLGKDKTSTVYTELQKNRADRLKDVGVGNVKKYLQNAYEPFLNDNTQSYSDFMADTPSRISSTINAYQTEYEAGKADRTKGFQDLLKDVRAYSYGTNTADGYTPADVREASKKDPQIGAATPEFTALARFRNNTPEQTQESLDLYNQMFGGRFNRTDYNALLDAGIGRGRIERNLMKFSDAGGKIGKGAYASMGYDLRDDMMGPLANPRTNYRGKYIVPQQDEEYGLFNPAQGMFNLGPLSYAAPSAYSF